MAVYQVKTNGEEPHKWKVETFANISGDETFVKHVGELHTEVDATLIEGQQRDDVKHAIMVILTDGLMPSFVELEQIRASVGKDMPIKADIHPKREISAQ